MSSVICNLRIRIKNGLFFHISLIKRQYELPCLSSIPNVELALQSRKLMINYMAIILPWASYQILKTAGCAWAGNVGNVFPAADFKGNRQLATPACTTARAPRTCRDACRDRWSVAGGKTFPEFPAHAQPAILRIWREAHAMERYSDKDDVSCLFFCVKCWTNVYADVQH